MARKPKPIIGSTGASATGAELPSAVARGVDRMLAIQRPVVLAHIRGIRRRHPQASPAELIRIVERRYLAAVTTGGAAVGATAVIPGIGTGVTLVLSGVETAGFLEATALFAQSVSEIHGIAVDNPDRARALVLTLMLGREGTDLVRQLAGQVTGSGAARNVYWGELVTNSLPKAVIGPLVDRLKGAFIRQFAARGGASFLAKAVPFGIGAVIGGTGNHLLGRKVLENSRLAFGQPPFVLPEVLEPRPRTVRVDAATPAIARFGTSIGTAVTGAASSVAQLAGSAGRSTARGVGSTAKSLSGTVGSTAKNVGSTARKALPRRASRPAPPASPASSPASPASASAPEAPTHD
ncbi:hypothetical protein [Compostimonas suwonensis]|uniref:EcsC family protein n=1 Tax=Compostimonas suwonensis TaxID=1048394 RepID=A0A2M9BWM4_9MICO|nr:hypothetical protein [Compostimonas suwonensis]PJJ62352.1 hypothetical protein CLV54_2152 [Compostimonas suwonensis]